MSDYDEMVGKIDWEKSKLVPVITQDASGEVLTLAYMDKEALELTLKTGSAHYYSRSKERIRMKGEVSGNVQDIKEIKVDCDRDSLLMIVEQKGPACHTGHNSCFFSSLDDDRKDVGTDEGEEGNGLDYSLNIMKELEEVIKERKVDPKEGSYTSSLFSQGKEQIDKKLGEESVEVLVADDRDKIIHESADLLYHLLVKLSSENIELKEVMKELRRRRG